MCFTCVSLFHYKISLLFFCFFSLFFFFASNFLLRFTLVIFASKWNKAKGNSSLFFHFFTLFCFFFLLFFALNFSLRFDLVIFAWKRNKAKRISSRFFRLIFTYFTFVFASDFWCFASKWIMWNLAFFASKRNKIFSSISNFASEVKVRVHPIL